MSNPSHIMVGDRPYCEWLDCQAGLAKARQSGVYACSHASLSDAKVAARVLQPLFSVPVRAVAGRCPMDA